MTSSADPLRHRAHPGVRGALTALVAITCVAGGARADRPVVLSDGQGLTVVVDTYGIASLTFAGDSLHFTDVDPLVVRLTLLAGGQVTWTDITGDQLLGGQPRLVAVSGTRCTITRSGCRVRGVAGRFDLVFDYELVSAPHGPGVAIHGRLATSTLARGIAGIGYRQYLAPADAPRTILGGFTGALELSFADLATGAFDTSHPYFQSGGISSVGYAGETFLTTRTTESMLVTATYDPTRILGLLVTRDGRADPDNVARELGFFGANVLDDPEPQLGFGLIGYLPNDDRPGNGGIAAPIGSGLVVGAFPQEDADDPYWDVVRAYRSRWVDPMLAGLDKPAERPTWMSRSLYMVLNVDQGGYVDVGAVTTFLDDFLRHYDQVRDVAILLWGGTDAYMGRPLPGLETLLQQLQVIAASTGTAIRPSLYWLPTAYRTDVTGGVRLAEVAFDPFGNPVRTPDAYGTYTFQIDTSGAANATFFAGWLDATLPPLGIDGVYLDDAFRSRSFHSYHYDPARSVQGRTAAAVTGYLRHMQQVNACFASRSASGYLITELGILGRSVPGNLVQGGPDVVQSLGPLFTSPEPMARFRPFLDDVAGHHWLSGYAGDISHQWLSLRNYDDILYFATPVVHGLVSVQAPFPAAGRYYDFFMLCRDGIIDCNDPRFRAIGLQSSYLNAAVGFLRRHDAILTGWRRQPLPGTDDIADHDIVFNRPGGAIAYRVTTPSIPHGCFSAGSRVAIALTNPTFDQQVAGFRIARNRYGMTLSGSYRVTVQRLQDPAPELVLEQATGDLVFSVRLMPREYAMVMIEPACTFTSTPNTPTCDGGSITGSSMSDPNGQAIAIHLTGAPRSSQGLMIFSGAPAATPLPGTTCLLLVQHDPSVTLSYATDAEGVATIAFVLTTAITAHVQCVTIDGSSLALSATNALMLECP